MHAPEVKGDLAMESVVQVVSVVMPALNEESTIWKVVEEVRRSTFVDEVIVVNNGSTDRTAEYAATAGADVIDCPEQGFGRALIAGFKAAKNDWVFKIDADIRNPSSVWVDKLVQAVTYGCSLVKGFWRNDEDSLPITRMLLRPGFAKLFPSLSSIVLPSGGIYLVQKSILPLDQMASGYSFDIDVVLRVSRKCRFINQVDLGEVYDRLRPISDYQEMAREMFAFMVDVSAVSKASTLFLLMAHPDDAEIWSGGTLLKHVMRGSQVTLAVATSEGPREKEAQGLVQQLPGVELHLLRQESFSHFNDARVVASVAGLLDRCKPEVVITHHFDDVHADHRRCFDILTSALLMLPRALAPKRLLLCNSYFQSSTLHGSFRPDTYSDISAEAQWKHDLILNHQTQDPGFWVEMVKRMDALNGMKCGVPYAEAFERYSFFNVPSPDEFI